MTPRPEVALNAENLLPTLVANRIAKPDEIEGCDLQEIATLEQRLGLMPRSYRDFLRLAGRRAGRLVERRELWIFADQLDEVNRLARERILDWEEPDDQPVPADAIFIGARYGEHPWFVLAGERADSPVFHFNSDTGKVTQDGISVWTWVETLVRDMRPHIRIAGVGEQPPESPLPMTADTRAPAAVPAMKDRRGWLAALWTMLIGGAVLIVGAILYQLYRAIWG